MCINVMSAAKYNVSDYLKGLVEFRKHSAAELQEMIFGKIDFF